jgi:hypothetical protein
MAWKIPRHIFAPPIRLKRDFSIASTLAFSAYVVKLPVLEGN